MRTLCEYLKHRRAGTGNHVYCRTLIDRQLTGSLHVDNLTGFRRRRTRSVN